MFVTLHDGTEARIHVAHKTFATRLGPRRGTLVKFVVNGRTFSVKAICSPTDNFSKKAGRKYAAEKFLRRARMPWNKAIMKKTDYYLSNLLTKEDRRNIFKSICPQFFPKKAHYESPNID